MSTAALEQASGLRSITKRPMDLGLAVTIVCSDRREER